MSEYIAELDGPQSRIEVGGRRILAKGGGVQPTTSTTSPTIPDELKPLANLYVDQATNYSNTPFQAYGGQRYADLTQAQNQGIGMVQNRALNGSQTMNNAEGQLQQQISGQANPYTSGYDAFASGGKNNPYAANLEGFMNPNGNPYLDSMVSKAQGSVVDQFNNMVKPQTEAAMQQSGSFGNSGYNQLMQNQQKAAATQMSDIATNMYGGAYQGDMARGLQATGMGASMASDDMARQLGAIGSQASLANQDQQNQMQAIGMAPTFGNAAYQDASQLLNAGNIQQQQTQNNMDFNYDQFTAAADHPLKQMQATSGILGQNMGSSSSGTQPAGGK